MAFVQRTRSGAVKRTSTVVTVRPRRPIDKILLGGFFSNMATQKEAPIVTATFPATFLGLRWNIAVHSTTGNNTDSHQAVSWAIVILRQGGGTVPAVNYGAQTLGTYFQPEQNVLATGVIGMTFEKGSAHDSGETATMRKLQNGDKIMFVIKSDQAENNVNAYVQIVAFIKS